MCPPLDERASSERLSPRRGAVGDTDEAAERGQMPTVTTTPRPWSASRGRSALVAGVVLVALLVAAGIVVRQVNRHHRDSASSPNSTLTAQLSLDTHGRLREPTELLDVHLQPPGDEERPMISAAEAERICLTPGSGCRPGDAPRTIALADATTDSYSTIQPDGSTERTIEQRLIWAVTWPSTCTDSGPATGTDVVSMPCTFLALIDARSGAPVFLGSG